MANVSRYKRDIMTICETGHRTAEEVLKEIRKHSLFIGLGTVYRNLTELVQEWYLMKQHGIGDKLLYEKAKPPHGHLFCQNTGMISDVDMSMVDFSGLIIPENFCMEEVQLTIAWHFKDTDSRYCKINGKILK